MVQNGIKPHPLNIVHCYHVHYHYITMFPIVTAIIIIISIVRESIT